MNYNCEYCLTPCYLSLSHYSRNKRHFCSRSCSASYTRDILKGGNSQFKKGHTYVGPEKGYVRSAETIAKVTGDKNYIWKGEDASYTSKHMWVSKWKGKASHCENDPTHTSWRFEWANISGEYKRDLDDYKQLCVPCHRKFDRKDTCKRGHPYTAENTYLWNNSRICRACGRINNRAYAAKAKA